MGEISIRNMQEKDIDIIYETFERLNWHPNREVYETYYKEEKDSKRYVYVAEYDGKTAGYLTLIPAAEGGPFDGKYPEIKDFNVFPDFRRMGIGNRMLDAAEEKAAEFSDTVTLAVGLHSGYGAAQRIYVKRGYIPDGSGVWYQGRVWGEYENCCNDDDLNLYFSKKLR